MTPIIKFSHVYTKLTVAYQSHNFFKEPKKAKLLGVFPIDLEDVHFDFREYDTTFHEQGLIDRYPLPDKGKFLLLIFMGTHGIFTTIRRHTPEKEKYYKGLIEAIFEVKIFPKN